MTRSRTHDEKAAMKRQPDVDERSRRPIGDSTRERLLAGSLSRSDGCS